VGSGGAAVFGLSGVLVPATDDYRIDVTYTASTKIASATLYEVRGLKVTTLTGVTTEAAGELPYTNTVSLPVDLSSVAEGDVVSYGGVESVVTSVVGSLVTTQAYMFPAEAGGLDVTVYGPVVAATTVMEIGSLTPDSEHLLDSFGAVSFDSTQLTDALYGSTRDALGKYALGGTWAWSFSDPSSSLRIREIPLLQDKPRNPTATWVGGVDFHITPQPEGALFEFPVVPADRVWAEYVAYDERLLSDIYGANVGVVGDSSEDYKTRLRGLYYAYFRGPRRADIRTGVHLLLGLPVADLAGTVQELETDYTGLLTRIRVADKDYTFPKNIGTELQMGDAVAQFQPLCRGVEVVDWITDPYWWTRHAGLHELQKYHTFELQAETEAPDLKGLPFALSFIANIAPTWKRPFFSAVTRAADDIEVGDDIAFRAVLKLWDTLDDAPIPRYDSHDYSPDVTDWRYDQVEGPSWAVTAGIQRYPRRDGVRSYLYSLNGAFTLTNGSTTATAPDGSLTSNPGPGAATRKYVAVSQLFQGTGGATAAGGFTLTDASSGAFTGAVAGGLLSLGGHLYRIVSTSEHEVVVDEPFPSTASSLAWAVVNEAFLRGRIDSVTSDTELEFAEPFTGDTGTYLMSLIDLAVMSVRYDQQDELYPEEALDFEATLSVGYGETLIGHGITYGSGVDMVSGFQDAYTSIGPGGPVTDDVYLSDPRGRWHKIVNVSSNSVIGIETPATESSPFPFGWVVWKSKVALVGDFAFSNGSSTVTCTDSQTGILSPGDYIQAVPALGATPLADCPVVQVDSIDMAGTTITLAGPYSGINNATTKVIRRGPSSMLPKTIDLPTGRGPADVVTQDFTEFQPGAGSELTSTVAEPS
jgi:hypothetical protein